MEIPAALEMLDEEHEVLPQQRGDKNGYHLGSIAGKNVVIAGLWVPGTQSCSCGHCPNVNDLS